MAHSPYYLVRYMFWRVRWWWRFTVLKEEYGEEEKVYLTRRKMNYSESVWQVNCLLLHVCNSINSKD